jgi:TfoX/Sxy family transcriptional regulator of competence genes
VAYDEKLAARLRQALAARRDVVEKKMFGGLAFMVRGHMAVGIVGDDLMVKCGAEQLLAALARPHARPMDFTGTPSKGMVFVGPEGVRTAATLSRWIQLALDYNASQPAK